MEEFDMLKLGYVLEAAATAAPAATNASGANGGGNGLRAAAAAALGNNADRSTIKRRIAAICALSRVKCS